MSCDNTVKLPMTVRIQFMLVLPHAVFHALCQKGSDLDKVVTACKGTSYIKKVRLIQIRIGSKPSLSLPHNTMYKTCSQLVTLEKRRFSKHCRILPRNILVLFWAFDLLERFHLDKLLTSMSPKQIIFQFK